MNINESTYNLYIFRHGQTDYNLEKRIQSHLDIPLNDTGREQAIKLIDKFKKIKIDAILTSDLSRASETCAIAFKDSEIKIMSSNNLREAYLGEPQGMLISEIQEKYGRQSWQDHLDHKEGFCYPGGESSLVHFTRLKLAITDLHKNESKKDYAISTHGWSLVRMINSCENSPKLSSAANCELHHVQVVNSIWYYKGLI
jgi:probable phosphoglycerate mutase